jgi:drug/metabolite transporter (DMT)-like permease
MILGLCAALGSAVCYGFGSTLQAVSARRALATPGVDPRLLLRMGRQVPFLAALALDTAGFAGQIIALRSVPIFLVQAAQAASIAVTALAATAVFAVRLRGAEWAAIATVIAGIVALGLSAGAEGGTPGFGFGLALFGAVVILAVIGFLAGRIADPTGAAVLGAVAGLGFGVVALGVRAIPGLAPTALLTNPASYAVAAGGVLAFLFFSSGLQRGTVTVVTTAMVVGETVLPGILGVFLLGDRARPGTAPLAVVGFLLAVAGAVRLARFGELPKNDRRPDGR